MKLLPGIIIFRMIDNSILLCCCCWRRSKVTDETWNSEEFQNKKLLQCCSIDVHMTNRAGGKKLFSSFFIYFLVCGTENHKEIKKVFARLSPISFILFIYLFFALMCLSCRVYLNRLLGPIEIFFIYIYQRKRPSNLIIYGEPICLYPCINYAVNLILAL